MDYQNKSKQELIGLLKQKDLELFNTLQTIRSNTFKKWGDSKNICPVCDSIVHLYSFNITELTAKGFIMFCELYLKKNYNPNFTFKDLNGKVWVHTKDYFEDIGLTQNVRGGFTKLKYFGLIEKYYDKDGDNPRNGYWKVTQKGIDFYKGNIKIPKFVYTYNDKAIEFSEDTIELKDTWGTKFDYYDFVKKHTKSDKWKDFVNN